jgi:hypothetical protein
LAVALEQDRGLQCYLSGTNKGRTSEGYRTGVLINNRKIKQNDKGIPKAN